MLTALLDVDYSAIAPSGMGAKYNEDNVSDNMTTPTIHSRVLGSRDKGKIDPSDLEPLGPTSKAIVVYIGQNDESAFATCVSS